MGTPLLDDVLVPAGRVDLADARTGRTRGVELEGFHLARFPVTVGQHRRVLDADRTRDGRPGTGAAEPVRGAGVPVDRRDDVPVHGVTWFEAVLWCNTASRYAGLRPAYRVDGRSVHWDVRSPGFRLPTEAEWEHACRAGSSEPRHGPLGAVAWTADDAVEGPQPVGTRDANAFGLHDMLGNVWEWCWDYADTARYGEYRSLRGGGWSDRSWSVRAGVRRGSAPDARIEDVGFRVARGVVGVRGTLEAQGWSDAADRARARVPGLVPLGWTPLAFPTPERLPTGDGAGQEPTSET